MAAMAGLPLAAGATAAEAADSRIARPTKPVLVAYFSRSGNTRVIAALLSRSLGATLFEIVPASPYPEDYLETVEQARKQRDQGVEPPLKGTVPDFASYATIFLGMPIWGETAPPPIRSFLSAHDLTGKTLIPFITHGGYGLGSSQSVIARHAPKARILPPFSLQADQERQTMERVNTWLGKPPATK
ncbi:MAG: flavodoxin [Hyphomicrobiales bacterium]|nr:MAG: flavodoxin [Hyphomicrobiales bacterium]